MRSHVILYVCPLFPIDNPISVVPVAIAATVAAAAAVVVLVCGPRATFGRLTLAIF